MIKFSSHTLPLNEIWKTSNKKFIKTADEFILEDNISEETQDQNVLNKRFNLDDFKNTIKFQGIRKLLDMTENPTVKDAIDTIYKKLSNIYNVDTKEHPYRNSNFYSTYWDTVGKLLGFLKQDTIKTKEEFNTAHDYANEKLKEDNKSIF